MVTNIFNVNNCVDFDGAHKNVCTTPVYSLSNSKVHLITSPALQSWLCSPCSSDILTPKASNNQVLCIFFDCVETILMVTTW